MGKPATTRRIRQCLIALVLYWGFAYSAAVQAEWLYREEAIMGTRCAVELWATDRAAGEAAMEAVFADMRRIDMLMSTYLSLRHPSRSASRLTSDVRTE